MPKRKFLYSTAANSTIIFSADTSRKPAVIFSRVFIQTQLFAQLQESVFLQTVRCTYTCGRRNKICMCKIECSFGCVELEL